MYRKLKINANVASYVPVSSSLCRLGFQFTIDPEKEFIAKLGGKMQNSSAKSETLGPIERDRRWKEKMENVTVQVSAFEG